MGADRDAGAGAGAGDLEGLRYEELVARLEDLTTRMAARDVGIEEAADLYEEAGRVYRAASERLARVQERIEKMRAAGGSGGAER